MPARRRNRPHWTGSPHLQRGRTGWERGGIGRGARAADLALVVVPRPATTAAQGLVGVSIGALLAATTGASALDAFLATTPGGLYAVLATARDGGADPTFVLAVRVLRRFAVLLAAPLLARWLRHTGE